MPMTTFSRTWWGKRFIEALESFTDPGRLARGRSYAKNGKIVNYQLKNSLVTAKVQGSINPYFGVYEIPYYKTEIRIGQISDEQWTEIIKRLSQSASLVSKLLLNEMPDNIDAVFEKSKIHLLPKDNKDFKTKCSCPDYENPCKHIAGVYYLLAQQLDQDPFLLFELRGLSRERLQQKLSQSPLGQILSAALSADETTEIRPAPSFYTQPQPTRDAQATVIATFWHGKKPLPTQIEPVIPPAVSAILLKKAGDFPLFWKKDTSFIGTMEEFYERVRSKSKELL
jgi:uncharacterized Zn finger protein